MGYTFYASGRLTVYYLPGGYSETRAKSFIESGFSYESNTSFCKFREYKKTIEPDLILPKNLVSIGDNAFSGITDIIISVPETVNTIGSNPFESQVTILCPPGSYAETYLKSNGYTVITENN